jgi:hypothetical protein
MESSTAFLVPKLTLRKKEPLLVPSVSIKQYALPGVSVLVKGTKPEHVNRF